MRDGKGFERHLNKETESKTEASNKLKTKLIVLTRRKKKVETSSVDTDITLTGVFAAEAVIMLLEIWT